MNCPHCKTSVDVHKAGRCLDAWVETDVFDLSAERVIDGRMEEAFITIKGPVPPRSTSIAAAWEVVEKINDDNAMILRWHKYNPDGRTSVYSVAFGLGKKIGAEASSAPLAICRAALKATGTNA